MSKPSFIIVAIDGGAASGKSSTASALGERHHLLHVDTGSFYRTITLYLINHGVAPDDTAKIREALRDAALSTRIDGGKARMAIDGEIPGEEIRSRSVNDQVSGFASNPVVREYLLDYQRGQAGVAREHGFSGLVMEGRDIGSVIFPDADFRFFLEADPDARNRRRAAQGHDDRIAERDRMDAERKTAPLKCPENAIRIDTTQRSLEEVIQKTSGFIREGTTA